MAKNINLVRTAVTRWFTDIRIEPLHTGQVRRTRRGVYIYLLVEQRDVSLIC